MYQTLLFVVTMAFSSCSAPVESVNTDSITDLSSYPEMISIKGGTFEMGVEGGEFDEGPVHKVNLSDFAAGKYEVTVRQYSIFAKDTGRQMPETKEWSANPKSPILNISWNDANAYVKWLSKKSGDTYRLPTEAEWYFLASDGGKKIKYPWGNGKPRSNVADVSASKEGASRYIKDYDDGFPFTSPVGSFPSNSLGVHDLGGNAAEWVSNYHYTFPKKPQSNPMGPSEGKNRVFKGGSFRTNAWYSRIAQRNFMPPTFKADYLGFRVVKEQ